MRVVGFIKIKEKFLHNETLKVIQLKIERCNWIYSLL